MENSPAVDPNPQQHNETTWWREAYLALRDGNERECVERLKKIDENTRDDVLTMLKWFLNDRKLENFVMTGIKCRVGKECLFVAALISLGPILDTTSNMTALSHLLKYPIDDLEVALRYYKTFPNILEVDDHYGGRKVEGHGIEKLLNESIAANVKLSIVKKAWSIATACEKGGMVYHEETMKLMRVGREQPRPLPKSEDKMFERVREVFNKAFGTNHVFRLVDNDCSSDLFYDDSSGNYFKVHPDSIVNSSVATVRGYFSVYAQLRDGGDGMSSAGFITHVSVFSKSWMSSIYLELAIVQITAGPLLVRNLSKYTDLKKAGAFVFKGYDQDRCNLTVICDRKKQVKVEGALRMAMVQFAKRRAKDSNRHVYLAELAVTASVGPGLQVLHLEMDSDHTSIMFQPMFKCESEQSYFDDLVQKIEWMNVSAKFSVRRNKDGQMKSFVATFPSINSRMLIEAEATKWGYYVKNLHSKSIFNWESHQAGLQVLFHALSECSICLTDNIEVVRLALCGHVYCLQCARSMMEFAMRFPVECCHQGCVGTLLFEDIDVIMLRSGIKAMDFLTPIIIKSLKVFIGAGNLVTECSFQDCRKCGRILKLPPYATDLIRKKKLRTSVGSFCSGCNEKRCAACGFEDHQNESCEECHARRMYGDDGLMKWRSADPETRSFCPNMNCHMLMEKNGGCNHMVCACGTHFCWICKYKGKTMADVYKHLQEVHSGNE